MKNRRFFKGFLVCILFTACGCSQGNGTTAPTENHDTIASSAPTNVDTVATSNNCDKQSIENEVNKTDERMNFAFVGDIMMGTTYPKPQLTAQDGKEIFNDVAELLRNADVAAGNLEGVLFDGVGTPKGKGANVYCFKMPERYIDHLTDAGFDLLSVANNHVNDFGSAASLGMSKILEKAGIGHSGLKSIPMTTVIERNGKKIGYAAFGHNAATNSTMDYETVKKAVSELDKTCDIVVVSFHGGAEGSDYTHVPHQMETYLGEKRGDVEKFAHTAIDAGADVVYGHGPHVTRGLELYKDRLICYSLGNFATPYGMSLTGIKGHAPVVTVVTDGDGKFVEGKIHSFIQQKGVGPRTDATNSVAQNMKKLTEADFPKTGIYISDDGSIKYKR